LNKARAPKNYVFPDVTEEGFPEIKEKVAMKICESILMRIPRLKLEVYRILL
jgi:hypothetical protein